MGLEPSATYTITGPDSSVAVLSRNNGDANFCGFIVDISGLDSPEVRESADNVAEGDGGVHGGFFYGRRPFTFEVWIPPDATAVAPTTASAKIERLQQVTNAMRADGTITWVEAHAPTITRTLFFRRQQPLRITMEQRQKRMLLPLVSADPRIYSGPTTTGVSPVTNSGNTSSPPSFTFTPSGGSVAIARAGGATVTLQVGTGYLTAGTAVTVDFKARTVVQGGVSKYHAVVFPSEWWELDAGSTTWSVSNASSVSITYRSAWI